MKCYQRVIRERLAEQNGAPAQSDLGRCSVHSITKKQAEPIIKEYEWLGTMNKFQFGYGLFDSKGDLIGVSCFGHSTGIEARDVCRGLSEKTICLERGACVYWAHPHSASYLISRACRLAREEHEIRVVYAYSDPSAGEIGTIYQALNWFYIGQGVNIVKGRVAYRERRRVVISPSGKRYSSTRILRHGGRNLSYSEAIASGWKIEWMPAKHKYVYFPGSKSEKKDAMRRLRYPVLSYPKRGVGGTSD